MCFQSGVKLDFRHFGWVRRYRSGCRDGTRSHWAFAFASGRGGQYRRGAAYGQDDFVSGAVEWGEATMFLLERGIRVTGTDAWSGCAF